MGGFRQYKIPLSMAEVGAIFKRFARAKDVESDQRLRIDELAAATHNLPDPMEEAIRAKGFLMGIDQRCINAGQHLEVAFWLEFAQETLMAGDVRKMLHRYETVENEQWNKLLPFLNKTMDGKVYWRPALEWAGIPLDPRG